MMQKRLRRGFLGLRERQREGEGGGVGVKSEGKAPVHCDATLIEWVQVLKSLIRDNGCDAADAAAESSSVR